MRFLDANIVIYAVLKPKKNIGQELLEVKKKASGIFRRINDGEEVVTTASHISEIANVLEDAVNLTFSIEFIIDLLSKPNIKILGVSREDYILSALLAKEKAISINDALAYLKMKELGIESIYTVDKHFKNLDVDVIQE